MLLRCSALVWLSLLALAAARAAAHAVFHSRYFRALLRRRQQPRRAARPRAERALLAAWRWWRAGRLAVVQLEKPEPLVARLFGLPRFIGAVAVCVLYIVESYQAAIPTHFYVFQALYGAAVGVKLLLGFVYSPRPTMYLLSLSTILDCLSIPSLMLSREGQWLNYNFLQAYSGVLSEWALLEKHDVVLLNYPVLARLLVNLVLQLLAFLFITSCGIQQLELLGDPGEKLASETFQITWANSVYFAVVTLMTVGYGDFVPYSLLGRLWIVFHIIFAAYLVTREISLLIDALKSMRRGGGSYVKASGSDHVVVTGHVKWEFLVQFVKEFLAEREHLDVKIVVLCLNNDGWTEEDWNKFVQSSSFFDYHLIFLEGSPLKPEDLARAKAEKASGIFLLADPHNTDPFREDSDTLKSLLTVRNFATDVPIYTINALHDSSFQFKIAMEQINPTDTAWLYGDRSSNYALATSRTYNTFTHLLPATPGALQSDPIFGSNDFEPSASGAAGTGLAGGGSTHATTPVRTAREPSPSRSSLFADRGSNASPTTPATPGGAASLSSPFIDPFSREEEAAGLGVGGLGTPLADANSKTRKRSTVSSESVCMQKLEMALLAESVFCNGLSTLVTNLAMRVQREARPTDPPWLLEYKLGSECGVRFLRLPPAFRGRRVGDVAAPLYDYGMVILAVRRSPQHNWRLLHTESILDPDMMTAVLTYHEDSVLEKIAEHLSQFVLDRDKKLQSEEAARANEVALSPKIATPGGQAVAQQHQRGVAGTMHSMEIDDVADGVDMDLDGSPSHDQGQSAGSYVERVLHGDEIQEALAGSVGSARVSPPEWTGAASSSGHSPVPAQIAPAPIGAGASPLSNALRQTPAKRTHVPPLPPLPVSIASRGNKIPQRRGRRAADPGVSSAGPSPAASTPVLGVDLAGESTDDGCNGSSEEDGFHTANNYGYDVNSTGESLPIYTHKEKLPARLKDHIIVCLDGDHSLLNLDFLLRRIWTKRRGQRKRTPVVVIHPSYPRNFEREVPRGRSSADLFLLKGNALSADVLEQAQFQTSRSILIMSPESPTVATRGSTDSKAIFTVMTLDSLLLENSNTFVCCMLDAEDSLQLLLSPRRMRRRFVNLGEQREASVFYRDRSFVRGSTSFHQLVQRTASAGSLPFHSSMPSSPFISVNLLQGAGGALESNNYGSISFAASSMRQRTGSMGARPTGTPVKRSASMRFYPTESPDAEYEAMADGTGVQHLRVQHHRAQGLREETAERQRFASGEMMISSFFAGLLVREYVEPGFVQLIREMIGTGAESRRSWIRQIDIPESWAGAEETMEGRTYRETIERLVSFGCIPLGLYRSGDAPVRMEYEPEESLSGHDGPSSATTSREDSYTDGGDYAEITRSLSQQAGLGIDAPLLQGSYLSIHDELGGMRKHSDDFDELHYDCPTTHRRIRYREAEEASGGENVLPYVYTNPEPYTLVAPSDAVFVLCPPKLAIPTTW